MEKDCYAQLMIQVCADCDIVSLERLVEIGVDPRLYYEGMVEHFQPQDKYLR